MRSRGFQLKYALAAKSIFILVWCVLFGEIFLRVLAPVPILPRYIESSEAGIRVNMRNVTYEHKTPDYSVDFEINSQGFRWSRVIPIEKNPDVFRIVVLGDSFGMAYGVDLEDSYLTVMRDRLFESGLTTEVVNLSVSGYGSAEHLIALEEFGLVYQPDLVLMLWHATDEKESFRSGLFAIEQGKLVRASESYLPGVEIREFLFSLDFYRFLADNSHLYNLSRDQAGLYVKRLLTFIRTSSSTPEAKNSVLTKVMAAPNEKETAQILTQAIVQEIKDLSHAHGAAFLIADIPRRVERSVFVSTYRLEMGDTPIVDVLPAFRENAGNLLFWERSHGHFTPLGYRLFGEAIAEEILDKALLN